jgi:aromatic ring-opening dioxygenase catalytic subunit (LigB family)
VTAGENPELIYDYYNFPPHTYELTYPAPGKTELAANVVSKLTAAGLRSSTDANRGFDHGMFIPLKVMFPDADIPVVQLSLDKSLDPALHIKAGDALADLAEQNVLIIGSGMSFHNMRGYRQAASTAPSKEFDDWLTDAITKEADERHTLLADWENAPQGKFSHPREEHLIPLMVAAGAGKSKGTCIFKDEVLNTMISAFEF